MGRKVEISNVDNISSLFNSIHQMMNLGISYGYILDFVFTALDSFIPFDRIGIALLENDNQIVRTRWVKSKLPVQYLGLGYSAELKRSSLQKVLESGHARIIDDLEEYQNQHPQSKSTNLVLSDQIRSNLTFPLVSNGKSIGFVFFSSRHPFTYHEGHIGLLKKISDSLSLIIEQHLLKTSVAECGTKNKLFHQVIHDLNNPLFVILCTLKLITKKQWYKNLRPDDEKVFSVLLRNAEAMKELIAELMSINEILANRVLFKTSPEHLSDVMNDILSDSEAVAKIKNIKVALELHSDIPNEVHLHSASLKKAMGNLVSNAIKYSDSKTLIVLKVEYDQQQKRLLFKVIDQGQGIPSEELPLLYREFGKTSVRPTGGESSNGLGLANVKRLIECQGGKVFAESKVGLGSTFGFWLPNIPKN